MGSQVHCIGRTPIQVVSQLPVDVECVARAATGLTNTDFYPLVSFVRCKLHSVYGRILLPTRSFQLADCVPEQHLPTKGSSPSASVALQLVKSSVEEMLALCELSKVKLPSIGWFSSHTWKRTSFSYWSIFSYVTGTTVTATVSQIVDDVLFVLFGGKLTGCVREKNYKDGVKVETIV